MPAKMTVEQQVEKYIYREPNSGCWIWTASLCADGYGKARNSSFPSETLAHRLSWLYYKGSLPRFMEIDHKCRVRCCVNPSHMEVVSHAVNVLRGIRSPERHRNGRKTHCKRGHELSGENLYIDRYTAKTTRQCRTCRALRQAARRAKANSSAS